MFGHQDDQSNQQPSSMDNGSGVGPGPAPTVPPPLTPPTGPSSSSTDTGWQHPGSPLESEPPTPATVSPTQMPNPQPTNNNPPAVDNEAGAQDIPEDIAPGPVPLSHDMANDLLDIKQQALSQLSPLVGHLEQSPEEKFRTTMMMIQASDDQSLIRTAFEAAQAITDERVRAQALLDVVNEINYFTQNQPNG